MSKLTKNTRCLNFNVIINQDEDGLFVADCPAIPGCHSQGSTYEEAIAHIEEAIQLCLAVAEQDPDYQKKIQVPNRNKPSFIGISNVFVPRPSFV